MKSTVLCNDNRKCLTTHTNTHSLSHLQPCSAQNTPEKLQSGSGRLEISHNTPSFLSLSVKENSLVQILSCSRHILNIYIIPPFQSYIGVVSKNFNYLLSSYTFYTASNNAILFTIQCFAISLAFYLSRSLLLFVTSTHGAYFYCKTWWNKYNLPMEQRRTHREGQHIAVSLKIEKSRNI